ncbi:MAG: leucine-rich repeat protein [Candidatus Onthovivens sp.]|nr:leucine-rich repeat protein [Candidatus Onthovivens sp.]
MGIHLGSTPVSVYTGGIIVKNSGQYVWSKQESETGKMLEYVIGDTESDYPDGGWKDGFWYVLNLAPIPTYLSFIGNEEFTLKTANTTKNWDGTLEYSTDKSNWATWNGTEISSAGSKLYLRGTGNTKITGNSSDYRFVFAGADALKIACKGNIENLLDYETVSAGGHPTMANSCYSYMFRGCASLTTAPALPATTLADYCYNSMFTSCTSLTTAPVLPATTLAMYCYSSMFRGCTSLTTAPALPATTLADCCYSGMFFVCRSLTSAPELPATTLADYCYSSMFRGCISLTTAPELPATTLDTNCYYGMFHGCTSLTTAPVLPATKLADYCYHQMFNGCRLIKLSITQTGEYHTAYRIPTSGTGTTATDALTEMFSSTGGTFVGTPEINTIYYTSNTVV